MMSVPAAIGLPDVANRALTDIKSRNEAVRTKGTKALATFLEAEIREISGEKLSKLLGELNKRIGDLVSSAEVHEKLGGIEAIDTLLEIDCDEAMSQGAFFFLFLFMAVLFSFPRSFLLRQSLEAHVSVCGHSGSALVLPSFSNVNKF
jgi:FKBP12-rapamycin complex-associated protein